MLKVEQEARQAILNYAREHRLGEEWAPRDQAYQSPWQRPPSKRPKGFF